MTGHVFVVRGRLESIGCDAVVVPTDDQFRVEPDWTAAVGAPAETVRPPDWGHRRSAQASDGRPVWFLDVGRRAGQTVDWLYDGLRQVLESVADAQPKPGEGRVRPLVAMPTIGVAKGGFDAARGQVIESVIETAESIVAATQLDVVIVVLQQSDYAAFQAVRRERQPWHLGDRLELARKLGERAQVGDLSLLLGAGVSVPAGLPSWPELLEKLRADAPTVAPEDFSKLGLLDQAELLRKVLGETELANRVAAAACSADKPALSHALLASLNVPQVVTTNYDSLYEAAFRSAHPDVKLAVLPWDDLTHDGYWLLKMHGDAGHADSIVLSRRDFVTHDAQRRPVGSVVQTLMTTSHLLVVGASMTDDNVLRLAHEVSAMLERHQATRPLGTVLTLTPEPQREALWKGAFDYHHAAESDTDVDVAARELTVLLDAVAAYATSNASFLLDPRYASMLSEPEQQLAHELSQLAGTICQTDTRHVAAWDSLVATLRDFGFDRR